MALVDGVPASSTATILHLVAVDGLQRAALILDSKFFLDERTSFSFFR